MVWLFCCCWFADTQPRTLTLEVGASRREALVYAPRGDGPSPLVFVFHGHGGEVRGLARRYALQEHWPEALVVYPQGLPTRTSRDPEGKRAGWQNNPGEQDDKDVKFFDALLERLTKDYKVDLNRIYVMGHSNGSRFACVLWNLRGQKFAALCTSGGQGGRLLEQAPPRPVVMIAGKNDPIVKFDGQLSSINAVRKAYGCSEATGKKAGYWQLEAGKDGLELVTYLHPGGHEFPAEILPKIVEFWKRHPRKETGRGEK